MEHRTDAPDALLTRALEEQLNEQRALNNLLARVEDALTGVQRRMDGVERRLDAQEQALRAVSGAQESAEQMSGDVRAGLERQAEHLGALRAELAGDAGRAVEQLGALTEAVEAMHGELADAIRGELLEHVRSAAQTVDDAAARLGGISADHAANTAAAAEAAHVQLRAAGERAEALGDAVARLQSAEAEITDALARLGDGLERAAQEAARAGRIHSVRALEPTLARLERLGDTFVERLAGAEPELTCRACGFRAKNRAGLAAHRRSHG